MANPHAEYIERTWPGGLAAYQASQQQRYRQAVAAGDTDLIKRLEADAKRVGYTLPTIPSTPTQSRTQSRSTGGNLTAEEILRLVQQPPQTPDFGDIMRQVREALDIVRPPQIDFARALSTVQSSLAPYAEAAQRQLQEEGVRALRALQAQQAMAGIAGSPAQRAIQQLTEAQAQAASDLAARLQTAAAEQALNLIAAQTDRFRTQAAAEAAAQQLAQSIFSELAATQRAQQAGLLNALLGLYQTQAGERQAMLPYTAVPLASLLPYVQPTQQDILQFILDLLGQTGGNLAGLGLY